MHSVDGKACLKHASFSAFIEARESHYLDLKLFSGFGKGLSTKGKDEKYMWQRTVFLLTLLLSATAWASDREITVELTVPDASWEIAIDGVYQVGDELWVVSTVSQKPDTMAAQVISTIEAKLVLDAPDLPEQYFVLGKTWNWPNQEPYRFLDSLGPIKADLESGKLLYRREDANCPFW